MPFQSIAQNAWGHTKAGTEALGGAAKVKEWEGATDYSHLPQHKAKGGLVKPGGNTEVMPAAPKGAGLRDGHFAQGGAVGEGDTRWTKKEPQARGELGQFLGTVDRFTGGRQVAGDGPAEASEEYWEKPAGVGHTDADDQGDTKCQPAIKPRKAGRYNNEVTGPDDVKKDPFWRTAR